MIKISIVIFSLSGDKTRLQQVHKIVSSHAFAYLVLSENISDTHIEDLTRVVISYEIYETSLRRVSWISYEMTTSVRLCLSYDCLKWDFIAFKVDIISIENITLSRSRHDVTRQ